MPHGVCLLIPYIAREFGAGSLAGQRSFPTDFGLTTSPLRAGKFTNYSTNSLGESKICSYAHLIIGDCYMARSSQLMIALVYAFILGGR